MSTSMASSGNKTPTIVANEGHRTIFVNGKPREVTVVTDGVEDRDAIKGILGRPTESSSYDDLHSLDNLEAPSKITCESCIALDLTRDKFIIGKGSSGSSARNSPSGSGFALKTQNRKIPLKPLRDHVKSASTCSLCYLVAMSVRKLESLHQENLESVMLSNCYATWEVDGRVITPNATTLQNRIEARTRRLHLYWDNNLLKDSYLVYVAPEKYLRLNSDAEDMWETDALFLGRSLCLDGDNGVLIKSWLDNCCRNHGPRCANVRNPDFEKMVEQSYFGVIDVLDMRLTYLPEAYNISTCSSDSSYTGTERGRNSEKFYAPYVAMSYVWGEWGEGEPYKTLLKNILVHRKQGGLDKYFGKLPQAIQDAINLTRRLGLRYIWIDSLCIVQDSPRSWKLNANVMNLIYGNALLTICAADGNDSRTGLLAFNNPTGVTEEWQADVTPGFRLMVSHIAESGIKGSEWDSRAWTFQERLLSNRCLIFTQGRVTFQCRSTSMSEDVVSEAKGAGWSLELISTPPQMLQELHRRAFWVYIKCIALYSARNLTQKKDILAAFNGVSNLIGQTMRAPFVFGLPTSHFDLALLWQPTEALKRRAPDKKKNEDFMGLEFPSWSWCGWEGGKIEYQESMIEGCLTNVHEWLMEHTWISWYIRDVDGDLRPLWDGSISREGLATENRWRGYTPFEEETNRRQERSHSRSTDRSHNHEPERRMTTAPRAVRGHVPVGDYNYRREELELQVYDKEKVVYPVALASEVDDYGRRLPMEVRSEPRRIFFQTLPETPYRVLKTSYYPEPRDQDQPLLQFWTWFTSFRLTKSYNTLEEVGKGLARYDISDENGDWCGSIVLDKSWVAWKCGNYYQNEDDQDKNEDKFNGTRCRFVAISEAKAFTLEECGTWTYYIPKERNQSEWDVYYVLLVEMDKNTSVWRRVALGKIFKAAFKSKVTGTVWKEIIMG